MNSLKIGGGEYRVSRKIDRSKVLLVALHSEKFPLIGESHGVCAIAGYLKTYFQDINVKVIDLQLSDLNQVIDFIIQEKPAIVGISVKLQTFHQLIKLHEMILKSISEEVIPLLVVGNAIPNFNGRTILEKYLPDVIIGIGEGELVMQDLYQYVNGRLPLDDVRNIGYWKDGKVHFNKREWLDGDSLGLPDRSNSYTFYNLGGEVYIEGSRGCPYGMCTICATRDFLGSRIKSKKWRPRTIQSIIEDLIVLEKIEVKCVTFADEDFFGVGIEGIHRAKRLAEEIISNNIQVHFRVNVRVDSIFNKKDSQAIREEKERILGLLKKAGLVKVFLGLESGVESQLKRYRKGFHLTEFKGALEILKDLNIAYEVGFIIVDPLMSFEELKRNIDFLENEKLIQDVSSIFKELRLQIGIPYINRVQDIEKNTGQRVLGKFDFNSQNYKVISYLDRDVDFIVRFMRNWIDISYKFYYLLRISTQYVEEETEGENYYSPERKIFFKIIADLRFLEFSLLKEMVTLIEERGRDTMTICNLMLEFERKRRAVVQDILSYLKTHPRLDQGKKLYREINVYIQRSEEYKVKILEILRVKNSYPSTSLLEV